MKERGSGLYRAVAEACGLETAQALLREFGGQVLRIPRACGPDHPLLRIGEGPAAKLCEHFRGEMIYVPRKPRSRHALRQFILDLYADDFKINDIARLADCSRRWVEIVLAESGRPKSRRQLEMF